MEHPAHIEEAILPFKIQQLVEIIMQQKSLGFTDALYYLYATECYKLLQSEDTKLWYMSGIALYEMIEKEKQKNAKKFLPGNRKLTLFLIFCLESYKECTRKNANEVLVLFSTYNVFHFLQENFEMLHTQGKEYIVNEIEEFLKVRTV